jgi:N-terminal domain of (some) glycogen debranching enzymes
VGRTGSRIDRHRHLAPRNVYLRFTIQLDADFSDLFQIKDGSAPPRLLTLRVLEVNGFSLRYERAGFDRALHIRITPDRGMTVVASRLLFELALAHGDRGAAA